MKEQIRCANLLLLNKTDLLEELALQEVDALVRDWNPYASVLFTVFSQIDMRLIEVLEEEGQAQNAEYVSHVHASHDEGDHDHDHDHAHENDRHHHHSHSHVMAYTHFFERAVDSNAFEEFVSKLPQEVYRAKGILSFSDTSSRFLFQYAYREMDFVKITPKGDVPDVAVFIGENFSKDAVRSALLKLETISGMAAKS